MKNIALLTFILFSGSLIGQTTTFDNLNANPLINKAITWTSSNFGNGFGHRIVNSDPGVQTLLNFQGRHNSTTWSDIMSITSNGKVGIGTTTPIGKLTVKGETYIEDGWLRVRGARGIFFHDYQGGLYMSDDTWIRTYGSKSFYHNTGVLRTDGSLHVGPNGNRFLVTNGGKVGIGTSTPDEELTVKGNIHAEEVKVDLSVPGPDYVFKEGYDLRSLEEVQNYIKEHGHLPNIPSAQEMEENGVELGTMNMKLLEKIEELMLYIFHLERRLSIQETINKRN